MTVRLFLIPMLVFTHGYALAQSAEGVLPEGAITVVDPIVLEQLAFDNLYGRGVEVDVAAALGWFEQAAAAGRPVAQMMLAQQYWTGELVRADRARALSLYRSAAGQGLADAQSFLGWIYSTGEGVEPDLAEARLWLEAAAHQEDAFALGLLATLYGTGNGVERNAERAHDLVLRAAELGSARAWTDAAASFIYGPESRRDVGRGLWMLEQVAHSNPVAAYRLGREHLSGVNVTRNYTAAAHWLSLAADAEHRPARLWLSELYAKGLGLTRDDTKANALRHAGLESATAAERNSFAWELAVLEDRSLRNGPLAVDIMEAVLATPNHERNVAYIDTLAAAYAEAGRFDDAVAKQLDAIDAMPADVSDSTLAAFRDRLERYRGGRALGDPP